MIISSIPRPNGLGRAGSIQAFDHSNIHALQRTILFLLLLSLLLPFTALGQKKKALEPVDTTWYNPGDINYNLLVAAYLGMEQDIRRFLRDGAYVNTTTMNGNTPLLLAAEQGHLPAVRLLLLHDAGVNKQDKQGLTPLMKAVMNGHGGIVDLLLRHGAGIEMQDHQGRTPLLLAAAYDHPDIVTLLLEKGALPDTPDKQGTTPLMAAVYAGHNETARLLIEHGADVNRKDRKGFTPLLIAVQRGNREMIPYLLQQGAGLYAATRSGYSALLLAVQEKDTATARLLLAADTAGFFRQQSRPNALALAVENKDADTRELLIDHDFRLKKNLYLDRMHLGGQVLVNDQDLMPGICFSLTEGISRLSLQTGFLYRAAPARILHQETDHTFWQMKEYRGIVYAGLGREFTLNEKTQKTAYGPYLRMDVVFSFGPSYSGSLKKPPFVISPSPTAGIFLDIGGVGIHAGYTWLDLHTYDLSHNHFSFSVSWIINRQKITGTEKTISWYNTPK